jgi:hypothetical protein
MKSSDISAKYSWPNNEQKDEIQDSGVPEEEDMALVGGGEESEEEGARRLVARGRGLVRPLVGECSVRRSWTSSSDSLKRVSGVDVEVPLVDCLPVSCGRR